MFCPSKILVPLDIENPDSPQIMEYAIRLAQGLDCELLIVHVIPFFPYYGLIDEAELEGAIEQSGRLIQTYADHKLGDCVKEANRQGVKVSKRVITGNPVDQILNFANSQKVDLIVIGDGCSGASCRFFGSITFKIIQLSKTPILVVPHGEMT